jgi:hypothetical protein
MAEVLIITPSYVRENTVINGNVEDKYLQPVIVECQKIYLHEILGTALYNEIISQVNSGSVSAANTTLINNYIKPCLLAYVRHDACLTLNVKMTNKNVGLKDGETTQPLDLVDLQVIMDHLKNRAEWYAERVSKFLLANPSTYPLYSNPGSTFDTIKPKKTNYSCGIYLGDPDEDCRTYGYS